MRTCVNGHRYYKSSDCPVCPFCEQERKIKDGFLNFLAAPARRALKNNGITSLKQLSEFRETEILKFHGLGPATIPILKTVLQKNGLSFKY